MMSMSDAPHASAQRAYRKICAWCRCDLGPLTYTADNHSYGICATCLQSHYADLLEEAPAPAVTVVRAGQCAQHPLVRASRRSTVTPRVVALTGARAEGR
jgi:hypothetical protein